MKHRSTRFSVLISGVMVVVLSGILAGTAAETWTRFTPGPRTKIELNGQGDMHDWKMEGEVVNGFLEVDGTFPWQPHHQIHAGKVGARLVASVPVTSLASGAKYRNRWFQHFIKADQYPEIVFCLDELVLQAPNTNRAAVMIGTAAGRLCVAGVTNPISTSLQIERQADAKLKISARLPLKLSDYKIEPPILRNIKDGRGKSLPDIYYSRDEVSVSLEWHLVRA